MFQGSNLEKLPVLDDKQEVIDNFLINSLKKDIRDALEFPEGYQDRVEELKSKKFSEAENFQELFAIIAVKGELIMAGKVFSAQEVIDIINEIKNGNLELNYITRTDGLRGRIQELLQK